MRIRGFITRTLFAMIALLVLPAAPARAQVEFGRAMGEKTVFVPKDQWIAGVSVSYTTESFNNYTFLIVEKLKGTGYTFKVSPMCMYAFANDLAAGGRFSYSRSLVKLDNASLVLGSDLGYDVDHLYSLSHSYGGTALFRNYIALGGSTRFGLIAELQLGVSGGQSKIATGTGQTLSGTYSRTLNCNIGVTPGLAMFLNNYSAIEVNVGVLGLTFSDVKMTTDQIYIANIKRRSANFNINLFSITFGTVFYI